MKIKDKYYILKYFLNERNITKTAAVHCLTPFDTAKKIAIQLRDLDLKLYFKCADSQNFINLQKVLSFDMEIYVKFSYVAKTTSNQTVKKIKKHKYSIGDDICFRYNGSLRWGTILRLSPKGYAIKFPRSNRLPTIAFKDVTGTKEKYNKIKSDEKKLTLIVYKPKNKFEDFLAEELI